MPGFDIGHIALLLGIALVVFGPARLQEITRTLGQTVTELRRASQGLPDLLNSQSYPLDTLDSIGEADEVDARDPGGMPLMDHFNELRSRLVKAILPVLVAAGICFFFSDFILRLLKSPAGANFQINAFGPMDGFVIKWKVALWAGLVLASPNWIYQLMAFVSPALTPSERHFAIPTLIAVMLLFVLGTAFGFVLLGGMVRVMFSMFGKELNYLPNADQYISFVVFFMLACGLVFELPAILLALVRFGVLKPEILKRQRKLAYFLLFAFAEIITPVADPIVAPMIVMFPLVILYESAIFATRWVLPHVDPQREPDVPD
jgi:sec-independent protein translocase protein TatC